MTTIHNHAAEAARVVLEANPALKEKIARAVDTISSEAESAMTEVIRFLQLVADADEPLTPSHKVDLAWHEFILFTRAYQAYCQEAFGDFIHHTPGGSKEGNHAQYRRTLAEYTAAYGAPSIHYWDNPALGPAASACGSCDGAIPLNLQV